MSFLQTPGRSLILSCLLATAGCGMRSTVTADADNPSLSQAGAAGSVFERDAGPVRDPDGFGGEPGIDTQQGEGPCGNGGNCNPDNLGGENCNSLGAGRGQLACDPVTCTYDLSMCSGGDGMFGGGGGTSGGTFGGGGGGGTNGGAGGGFFGGGGGTGTGGSGGGTAGGGFFGGGGGTGTGGSGGGAGGGFFGGGNMGGGGNAGGGGRAGGGFFGGGNAGGGANNGSTPAN